MKKITTIHIDEDTWIKAKIEANRKKTSTSQYIEELIKKENIKP